MAPPPTTAAVTNTWRGWLRHHLCRARRLRPPAAPGLRRLQLCAIHRLPAHAWTSTACWQLAAQADIVVKHSGIGVRRRLPGSTRACGVLEHAMTFIWDVDAPATIERMRADDRRRTSQRTLPALRRNPHLWRRTSRARWFPRVRRARLLQHVQRPGPRDALSRCAGSRAALRCGVSRQPSARPRGSRGRVVPPRRRTRARNSASCWAAKAGRTSRCRPTFATSATFPPQQHNRLNCSAGMVMNINRASMADFGFSPPTRVFEVAGAGACMLCDDWPGISDCFEPGSEILVVRNAEDVAAALHQHDARARRASANASISAACEITPTRSVPHRRTSPSASVSPGVAAAMALKPTRRNHGRLEACTGIPFVLASRKPSYEDRDLWPYDYLLLGQRPRHHLSLALKALARRGHQFALSRRMLSGTATIATCPSPASAPFGCMKTGQQKSLRSSREAQDADAIVLGSYFPDAIAQPGPADAGMRPASLLRHRHAHHAGAAARARPMRVPRSCAHSAVCRLSQLHRRTRARRARTSFRFAARRPLLLLR